MKLYSLRDLDSGCFGPPMCFEDENACKSFFVQALNDKTSINRLQLNFRKADVLFVGEFNDGKLTPAEPVLFASLSSFVSPERAEFLDILSSHILSNGGSYVAQ